MSNKPEDTNRKTGEELRQRDRDESTVDTDLPIGEPQTPAPEESQFLPDTGASTPDPPHRNPQDTREEARDGFMDRYPSSEEDE